MVFAPLIILTVLAVIAVALWGRFKKTKEFNMNVLLKRFSLAFIVLVTVYLTPYLVLRTTGILHPYYSQGNHQIDIVSSLHENELACECIAWGYFGLMLLDAQICDALLPGPEGG